MGLGELLARLGSRLSAESRIGSAESRAAIQEASRAAAELLMEASTTGTVLSDLLESVQLGASPAEAFIAPPVPGRQPMTTASVAIHFANIPHGPPGANGAQPSASTAATPQPPGTAASAQPAQPAGAAVAPTTRSAQFFISSHTLPIASACMPVCATVVALHATAISFSRSLLLLLQRACLHLQCSARARCQMQLQSVQ
jgi:hypothetical protein